MLQKDVVSRLEATIKTHENTRFGLKLQDFKNYLQNNRWGVLSLPSYGPNLAPSEYHLFRPIHNALTGI